MGFAEAVVIKALKKTGNAGLQPALDWIVANPNDDGTMEDSPEDDGEVAEESAQSLKCDDCGKLLRDASMDLFRLSDGARFSGPSSLLTTPLFACIFSCC